MLKAKACGMALKMLEKMRPPIARKVRTGPPRGIVGEEEGTVGVTVVEAGVRAETITGEDIAPFLIKLAVFKLLQIARRIRACINQSDVRAP